MTKTDTVTETPEMSTNVDTTAEGVQESQPPAEATTPVVTSTTVDTGDDDQPETFPREYVEKLRDENAKYRQRAGLADDLAKRLHLELVKGTGRLADPTDLPFDDAHLSDPDALTAAVEALLAAKPHLASRKPSGDIGQGATATADSFSLAGMLRSGA